MMRENSEPRLLDVGSDAPDFTLSSSYGDPVTLSNYRDRMNVCLVFYPDDGTPGCTRQLCVIRDDAEEFIGADVERFGVNPGSLKSHQAFAQQHEIDFPLLVDADLQVAREYHAVDLNEPRVLRTVYLVDKRGKVAFAARGYPETAEILEALHDEE
jgi:peroxiredoxin Q/BCP